MSLSPQKFPIAVPRLGSTSPVGAWHAGASSLTGSAATGQDFVIGMAATAVTDPVMFRRSRRYLCLSVIGERCSVGLGAR